MKIINHLLYNDDGKQVDFKQTPNKDKRKMDLKWLIYHFTAGASRQGAVNHFSDPNAKASAHLVIDRDGSITQCSPFNTVCWHAGNSSYDGITGSVNRNTIGIELVNWGGLTQKADGKFYSWTGREIPASEVIMARHKNGGPVRPWHTYTPVQLQLAEDIGKLLVSTYKLKDILGHEDICFPIGRKTDPSPSFPMENIRARLFGRHQ